MAGEPERVGRMMSDWVRAHRTRRWLIGGALIGAGILCAAIGAARRSAALDPSFEAHYFQGAVPADHTPTSAIVWMLVGAVLFVVGIAYPLWTTQRLRRTAAGGTARCLHCGAKRDVALAFCPLCGWRTQTEATEALPAKQPWEHEH